MSRIRGTVRGFAFPRWRFVSGGTALSFPRITRNPTALGFTVSVRPRLVFPSPIGNTGTVFAPVFAPSTNPSITFPRITRTPSALAPQFNLLALPTLQFSRITRNPITFSPQFIARVNQRVDFSIILRTPRAFPPEFGEVVTIQSAIVDPNPFVPTVPDSIRALSPELFDYLDSQARTLRESNNAALSGSQAWPIEYLTLVSATPAYPPGAKGRFIHPQCGIIQAIYCQFDAMLPLTGAPVGFIDVAGWVVTNDFDLSDSTLAAGFQPGQSPSNQMFGWVVTDGFLPSPVQLSPGVAYRLGGELIWADTGLLDYDSPGPVLARIVGPDLSVGSILAGGQANNGQFSANELKTRLNVLEAENGDTKSRVEQVETALADGTYATATQLNNLSVTVGGISSQISQLSTAYAAADQSLARRIDTVQTQFANNLAAEIISLRSALATAEQSISTLSDSTTARFGQAAASTASVNNRTTANATAITAMGQVVGALQSVILDESTGLAATATALNTLTATVNNGTTGLSATVARVSTLESTVNNPTTGVAATAARLTTEETTRATADTALATRATNLEATVNNPTTGVAATAARLTTEETTRATADTALAGRASALEATVNDGTTGLVVTRARLLTEETTRADADIALSNRASALESTVNNATTGVAATAARLTVEETTRATADTALATRATNLEATVNTGVNANATLRSDLTTVATAQSTTASQVTSLTTTVGSNSASITSINASINGIEARRSVTIDANGNITGYELIGGGGVSAFRVRADQIQFYGPGGVGGNAPFAVDTTTGEVKIEGRIIVDTGTHILVQGRGFGTSNQFVQWFGPKMALNLCSESNGIFWLKNTGQAYYAGGFSVGILTTKAATSSLSASAEIETARYGSNGGTIQINVTVNSTYYQRIDYLQSQLANFNTDKASVSPTPTNVGIFWSIPPQAISSPGQVQLWRSLNGGAYVLVATYTLAGSRTWEGTEPIPGDSGGFTIRQATLTGAWTYTDPSNVAQDRQYKLVMISRNLFWGSIAQTQQLSIVSIET